MDSKGYSSARILLVEDSAADAGLLIEILRQSGYRGELKWVTDGEQALDYLRDESHFAQSPRPDVVILDRALPKMRGDEVLRRMKCDTDLRDIPVFVLSTSQRPKDIAMSRELGAVAFMTKPLDLQEFFRLVINLISVEFPRLGLPMARVSGDLASSHG